VGFSSGEFRTPVSGYPIPCAAAIQGDTTPQLWVIAGTSGPDGGSALVRTNIDDLTILPIGDAVDPAQWTAIEYLSVDSSSTGGTGPLQGTDARFGVAASPTGPFLFWNSFKVENAPSASSGLMASAYRSSSVSDAWSAAQPLLGANDAHSAIVPWGVFSQPGGGSEWNSNRLVEVDAVAIGGSYMLVACAGVDYTAANCTSGSNNNLYLGVFDTGTFRSTGNGWTATWDYTWTLGDLQASIPDLTDIGHQISIDWFATGGGSPGQPGEPALYAALFIHAPITAGTQAIGLYLPLSLDANDPDGALPFYDPGSAKLAWDTYGDLPVTVARDPTGRLRAYAANPKVEFSDGQSGAAIQTLSISTITAPDPSQSGTGALLPTLWGYAPAPGAATVPPAVCYHIDTNAGQTVQVTTTAYEQGNSQPVPAVVAAEQYPVYELLLYPTASSPEAGNVQLVAQITTFAWSQILAGTYGLQTSVGSAALAISSIIDGPLPFDNANLEWPWGTTGPSPDIGTLTYGQTKENTSGHQQQFTWSAGFKAEGEPAEGWGPAFDISFSAGTGSSSSSSTTSIWTNGTSQASQVYYEDGDPASSRIGTEGSVIVNIPSLTGQLYRGLEPAGATLAGRVSAGLDGASPSMLAVTTDSHLTCFGPGGQFTDVSGDAIAFSPTPNAAPIIDSSPAALTSMRHVYVRSGGRLLDFAAPVQTAAVGIDGSMGAIALEEGPLTWLLGTDGNLWCNWWSGTTWNWANQGTPPNGVTITASMGAVAVGGRPYTWVLGSDGSLWYNWYDDQAGAQWYWSDQGAPSGATIVASMGAIVAAGNPYTWVLGSDGALWCNWWNGSGWVWKSAGVPPDGSSIRASLGTVAFNDQPYAWILDNQGRLWGSSWDGTNWSWTDQGPPANGITIVASMGAVSVGGRPYTWVLGSDGSLWYNWWDGAEWQWSDRRTPPNITIVASMGAVADNVGPYTWVLGSDGALWCNWWDGQQWQWTSEGPPADGVTIKASMGAVLVGDRPYTWVLGSDGGLWYEWWNSRNGSPGSWSVQGGLSAPWTEADVFADSSAPEFAGDPVPIEVDGSLYLLIADTDNNLICVQPDRGGNPVYVNVSTATTPAVTISGTPSAAATATGRLVAFARDADGSLRVFVESGSTWTVSDPIAPITGNPVSAPGATDVFARAPGGNDGDNHLLHFHNASPADTNSPWTAFDVGSAPNLTWPTFFGDPAVASTGSGADTTLSVFMRAVAQNSVQNLPARLYMLTLEGPPSRTELWKLTVLTKTSSGATAVAGDPVVLGDATAVYVVGTDEHLLRIDCDTGAFTDVSATAANVVIYDATSGTAGQAPSWMRVGATWTPPVGQGPGDAGSRAYPVFSTVPGDITSYTEYSWNQRMYALGQKNPDLYQGSDYVNDMIIANAVPMSVPGSKVDTPYLELEWHRDGHNDQSFQVVSTNFQESSWSLDASVYTGFGYGGASDGAPCLFGLPFDPSFKFMVGFTTNYTATADTSTQTGWGISVGAAWGPPGYPPDHEVPGSVTDYTFRIYLLPVPDGTKTVGDTSVLFGPNYWVRELYDGLSGMDIPEGDLAPGMIDLGSGSYKIVYVVTGYDFIPSLEVSPTSGPAGSPVELSGRGYGAMIENQWGQASEVTFAFTDADKKPFSLGTYTTDANWSFGANADVDPARFDIPASAALGEGTLQASAFDGTVLQVVAFTVT
jgi:hypothetical protein